MPINKPEQNAICTLTVYKMDKTKYYVPMPSRAEIRKENRFIAKALEEGKVMNLEQVMEMHNKMEEEKNSIKAQAKTNSKPI
jgi:hypothetical protein